MYTGGMKNGVCPAVGRPQKEAAGDGHVQSMMDWVVEMLRFCLKRGEHTENRDAHGLIDRLLGHFVTGIS